MARRGSGLRTAIKVVKAIDRANQRAMKDADRRRKAEEREEARIYRERERQVKEHERQAKQQARQRVLDEKQAFKEALSDAQNEYESRCLQREKLRKKLIRQVLR